LDDLYLTNARPSNSENRVILLSELARFSNHRLNTLSDKLREFLTASTFLRLASINVQSLLAHVLDLVIDGFIAMADLWTLKKSLIDDTGHAVSIDGYSCVPRFRHPDVRAGAAATTRNAEQPQRPLRICSYAPITLNLRISMHEPTSATFVRPW
jgi:hypothetical protein